MLIDFRQLFPKYGIKPNGVLHIGANIGEEAPVYLELGIKKQIWIEANPEIFTRLQIAISGNPNATAWNYCISDVEEPVIFHVANNRSLSSSFLEFGTHAIVHPETVYIQDIHMVTKRLDTLFNTFDGCDFLNVDLQGADLKAIKGMGELLKEFKWAYIEVNQAELYKGCALVGEVDEYMGSFGFRRVETLWCGNTMWGDALYIK